MTFVLTYSIVEKVLKTVDAGLVKGLGNPKPGSMCVEAAVCYALGLPHDDDPSCVSPAVRAFKIALNDCGWSSNKARANGLRRLAVLQLGTKDVFDDFDFVERLAIKTVNVILPTLLSGVVDDKIIEDCRMAKTPSAARAAARAAYAAAYAVAYADAVADAAAYAASAAASAAARAAAYADAVAYARAAAYADAAARAAAYAASVGGDKVFLLSAKIAEDILIEMNVPAVRYLSMIQ